MASDINATMTVVEDGNAVHVKMANGQEHVVPFTNIEAFELLPEQITAPIQLRSKGKQALIPDSAV